MHSVNEAFKHGKPICALGEGMQLLQRAAGSAADDFAATFTRAMAQYRVPLRPNLLSVPG